MIDVPAVIALLLAGASAQVLISDRWTGRHFFALTVGVLGTWWVLQHEVNLIYVVVGLALWLAGDVARLKMSRA